MNTRNACFAAFALFLTACTTMSAPAPTSSSLPRTNANGETFESFYVKLRKEAVSKGYSGKQLDAAFGKTPTPIGAVIKSENAQPELVRTFAEYTGGMLSANRIAQGTSNYIEHKTDLTATQQRTGVPASVVVALWGIETNFGKVQGAHPIVPALATLAWQSPRAEYFRKETFAALEVAKRTGKEPANLMGSWAGAMGQCQFMPSSYLAYATDGDNDGIADIWTNEADVFASAATYLQKRGWKSGMPWRFDIADGFDTKNLKLNSRGLSEPMDLATFKARGFKMPTEHKNISNSEKFRYYKPQAEGPAYLLGPNFSVILSWNNSSYFAWSVLSLADTIEQEANNR